MKITYTLYKEGEPQKVITERADFSQYAESKHIQGQVTRKKTWEEKVHKQDVNFERIVKQHVGTSGVETGASRAIMHRCVYEMSYKCHIL